MSSRVILITKPIKDGPTMYLKYIDRRNAANTPHKNEATVFKNEAIANTIAKQLPIHYSVIPA